MVFPTVACMVSARFPVLGAKILQKFSNIPADIMAGGTSVDSEML